MSEETPTLSEALEQAAASDAEVEEPESEEEPEAAPEEAEEAPQVKAPEKGGKDLDPEVVQTALALYEAVQEPEGLVQLIFEAGRALGIEPSKLAAVFSDESPSQAPAEEDEDDDAPLTKAELQALLKQQKEQEEAARMEQLRTEIGEAIDERFNQWGVDDEADRQVILTLADQVFDGDPLNRRDVMRALEEAHKTFQKRYAVAKQPREPGSVPKRVRSKGGTGSGPEPEPPSSLEDAFARAREMLGEA